jgi:four helix bundle protein
LKKPDKQKKAVMNKIELENRLIEFTVQVNESIACLDKHPTVNHLKDQVIRSSTATALNYAEAESAESKKDFIHKLGIVVKELRETKTNLRIMIRFVGSQRDALQMLIDENDELLAIFHKTIMTAKKNEMKNEKSNEK